MLTPHAICVDVKSTCQRRTAWYTFRKRPLSVSELHSLVLLRALAEVVRRRS